MKSLNYVLIAFAVLAVLIVVSPVRADVIANWQFNEATTGAIPNTGDPLLDSGPNNLKGNSRAASNATWAAGLTGGAGDGAMHTPSYNNYGVLMNHSSDYSLKLGDLQAYRFEFDFQPGDWYSGLRFFQYQNAPYTQAGYRSMVFGGASGGETNGGYVRFYLWDNSGVYWAANSDPSMKYLPDYRTNPGAWYHIAIEVHPMANQNDTYVQFYIDGVDAGSTTYAAHTIDNGSWTQANMVDDPTALFAIGSCQGSPSYNYAVGKSSWDNFMISTIVVPEPSTLALLGMGLFGLLAYAWRKRK